MHYEDLVLKEIVLGDDYWYARFISKRGGIFEYPIADNDISKEQLIESGIVIGAPFLGAIREDQLVGLDGFSFIASKTKSR